MAILPLVDTSAQAAEAVAAVRYSPHCRRSYGPMRSSLRIGPDPALADAFEATLVRVREAAAASGIHNPDGPSATKRLAKSITYATVSCDLVHPEQTARHHPTSARTPGATP